MPYKLTYFDIRARAETARMLFALADQEYEDVRINREQLEELKPKLPFGQVPVLEVDGQCICQSHTIERFLAKRFNLYGSNEFEQTKTDMIVDCGEDFIKPLIGIFLAKTDEEKETLRKKYIDETMASLLPKFEKMVSDGGYFLGSELMWVDVSFFNMVTWPPALGITVDLSKFPKLKGVIEKVQSNPKIDAWIKKRPETSM